MSESAHTIRRKIEIQGRVQGVGFRPFIYRLANELDLAGCVGNSPQGVFVEVEGTANKIDTFTERLPAEIPPLASLSSVTHLDIDTTGESVFTIKFSSKEGEQTAEISPDVATCSDCLQDILDTDNRRFRYPFTNCTNCGPRYSIIQNIPYDRPHTTMKVFPLCDKCSAEYDDPVNRRFHAQPNACDDCGPKLWLCDQEGEALEGDPIRNLANMLNGGMIAAIKGLGGFHLSVRADYQDAVLRLRERKGREAKPFALMVATLEDAKRIAVINQQAEKAMTHWSRPIVLVPKNIAGGISDAVAPDTNTFGIMLPYTPFHYLLFSEGLGPLVMTSGNPHDEPLCSDNDEALARLGEIADVFLMHNRDIERRVDDSVVMSINRSGKNGLNHLLPLRRSRGFVPQPIHLTSNSEYPVLAVGGEMKSTVCLLESDKAVLSEHLGELYNPAAYRNFVGTIDKFKQLLDIEPEVLGYDMHPDYASHRYAQSLDIEKTAIQHHHAHIISCTAENGVVGDVIGVACDGTGYGTDGNIWGCEILTCNETDFKREAHLRYYHLIGGDAGAHETWRPALGLLKEMPDVDFIKKNEHLFHAVEPEAVKMAARRLETAAGKIPFTSSLGRLFDAVSFLLGIRSRNRYEADAAISLEHFACKSPPVPALPFDIVETESPDEPLIIDQRPMIAAILEGLAKQKDQASLAAQFHETISQALFKTVQKIAARSGLRKVALSGGCFANKLLLIRLNELLIEDEFEVLLHKQVPAGDGGLSLGQAVIAAERKKKGLI